MQRYVWWDEVQKRERTRLDLRMPKPLHDFLREVATRNGVSVNSLVVGILAYIADADTHRRVRVEVINAVRVTDTKPADGPLTIPAPPTNPPARKRWRIPNVL